MRLLTEEEVTQLTELSPSTRYRMRRDGRFPQFVGLSAHIKRNTVGQIRKWLTERMAETG